MRPRLWTLKRYRICCSNGQALGRLVTILDCVTTSQLYSLKDGWSYPGRTSFSPQSSTQYITSRWRHNTRDVTLMGHVTLVVITGTIILVFSASVFMSSHYNSSGDWVPNINQVMSLSNGPQATRWTQKQYRYISSSNSSISTLMSICHLDKS